MKLESPYQSLINCLNDDELATPAKKLHFLLCDVAWTTSSEFLGAFGSEMEKIKQTYWDRMSEATKSSFTTSAKSILKTWPKMKL
jgi:phage-related protein